MGDPVRNSVALWKILDYYSSAKKAVLAAGFKDEIDWQDRVKFSETSETDFLREAGWVIFSSGMRESVIRKKFPFLSEAFFNWQSARTIFQNSNLCERQAMPIFGHKRKIKAVIAVAEEVNRNGFDEFKKNIQKKGIDYIQTLPFMGPATSYHLAKNIGMDTVKPDRHLLRVSYTVGYQDPYILCKEISEAIGDRISVVDLVIWRFATLNPNYLEPLFLNENSPYQF